ncbi:hypothetical protein RUND412_001753 [Rhizina undulata]
MAPAARTSKRKAAAVKEDTKNPAATKSVDEKPTANVKAARKPRRIATPKPKVASKAVAKKAADKPKKPAPAPAPAPAAKADNQPAQSRKRAAPKPDAKPAKRSRIDAAHLPKLTSRPTQRLNVYVFGTGEAGELGLGPMAGVKKEVYRPRLNPFLLPDKVGVVALAVGGMHCLALTHDGKVYSWGCNDLCALGRETTAIIREKNIDDDDSADDEGEALNELDSTPGLVEGFPEGTVITRIAAGDNVSFAVTDTGKVYGWGTFRATEGVIGFSKNGNIQPTPVLIPNLKNIVDVSVGNNHALAFSKEGNVYAWGDGEKMQLGRRVVERTRQNGLTPREFGLPRRSVKYVSTGGTHSFAITKDGKVWAWGLNNYGQCGIFDDAYVGIGHTIVPVPTVVEFLDGYDIVQIAAGDYHSAALTSEGDLFVWGRADKMAVGVDFATLTPEDMIYDDGGRPRVIKMRTPITDRRFAYVACGTENTIAIDRESGSAWSWGFNVNNQNGQGPNSDDVPVPTKIVNTATTGVKMVFAGSGGQFSVLGGIPPAEKNNGPNGN